MSKAPHCPGRGGFLFLSLIGLMSPAALPGHLWVHRVSAGASSTYVTSASWSITGSLNAPSSGHTGTLLPNGKVLVAGGLVGYSQFKTAELYDPVMGTWSYTGSLNTARSDRTATLLPNGKVLVVGGAIGPGVYLTRPTRLSNGKILMTGGLPELYDPLAEIWSAIDPPHEGFRFATATLLFDGRVLATGEANVQLFDSRPIATDSVTSASAASYRTTGLAAEAIAAAFGTGLSTMTAAAGTPSLPTSLGGTTVRVRDEAGSERFAPLFFVSPSQVNYQIPAGTAPGIAQVTITREDGFISTGVVQVNRVAPSLFAANADGHGVAAGLVLRVKADGSQSYESVVQFDVTQNKIISRPIDLGPEGEQVNLVLFGTGIRHSRSLASVIAAIGGASSEVSFAGAPGDFVGLDQVNVLVPRTLAGRGELDVLLTIEAQMTNPVRVQIK